MTRIPQRIVVRQQRGLRRAREMTTVAAAFYGACDGELTAGQIADALVVLLSDATGGDPRRTAARVAARYPGLAVHGSLGVFGLDGDRYAWWTTAGAVPFDGRVTVLRGAVSGSARRTTRRGRTGPIEERTTRG